MTMLSEVVARIHEASDQVSLKSAVADGFARTGFQTFQLAINLRDRGELMFAAMQTSGDRFLREFDRLGLVGADPIVNAIFNRQGTFYFNTVELAQGKHGPLSRRWCDFFRSITPIAGVVIPLPSADGRISAAVVSSTQRLAFDEASIAEASIIARVAILRAETLGLSLTESSLRLAAAGLTAHQVEVLQWAAQGKSNADIGIIMGRSKRAVDYHVSEILRKLGVSSRSQAVAISRGSAL